MDDKCIMENVLTGAKSVCGLFMHGTIEAATPNVHSTFNQALSDALCMQNEIYTKMSAKGWYPSEQVEQQKIQQTKSKFASQQ